MVPVPGHGGAAESVTDGPAARPRNAEEQLRIDGGRGGRRRKAQAGSGHAIGERGKEGQAREGASEIGGREEGEVGGGRGREGGGKREGGGVTVVMMG